MYGDYSPVPNGPPVLVITEEDWSCSEDEVIDAAIEAGATSNDGEDKIFWIVFAEEPRIARDFTERTLRAEIKRLNKQANAA